MNDNPEKPSTPARFPVGAAVRVKFGTMDPDFSNIHIGGWAGTIQESDPPMVRVKWHPNSLDQNPMYRRRCDHEGLEFETMWLDENDLEPDTGESVKASQATTLVRLPLSQEIQFEEVSTVPDFLAGMPFDFSSSLPKRKLSFTAALMLVLAWGAVIGIVLGSLVVSMEFARIMAVTGAGLLGTVGLIAGSRLGRIFGRLNQRRSGSFWGGLLGAAAGGIVGALLGAVTAAIVGVLLGGLSGAMVSNLGFGGRRKAISIFLGCLVGATVQAFLLDQEQALPGAIFGGAIGAGVAFLAIVGLRILTAVNRGR